MEHSGEPANLGDPARAVSVAPPGFVPTRGAPPIPPADLMSAFTSGAGGAAASAADAAVRWRLRAATIDNILVWMLFIVLSLVLHWNVVGIGGGTISVAAGLGQLFVVGTIGVAYHFAFESRGGQTPGKRRYGIRVVDAGGGPAAPRAILIRSVLRIIDQVPVLYLSGLISMVRTGPERRQRIGDVVAGTKVVAVDGRALDRGTAVWYLPAATALALAVTVLFGLALLSTPR